MTDDTFPRRHRPPHHAPAKRFNEPIIVQVNVCTKSRRPILAYEAGHRLCREIWQVADFWRVGHYVIMPDHIHLFCAPGCMPPTSLRQWVEYWKSRTAARWPITRYRTEPVPPGEKSFKPWQRDFWDTQMRSREHYEEKLSYVRMNPLRKGLATTPEGWPYQGAIHEIGWM